MTAIRALETNPGGVVAPEDLVGREAEVGRVLRSAERAGAVLLGDRRIGKTSILRAVEARLRAVGHPVVRESAETSDPAVFSARLANQLRTQAPFRDAWRAWEHELGGEVSLNVGVAGFKLVGKAKRPGQPPPEADLLTLAARATSRVAPYRVVIVIDEITVLAAGLEETRRGAAAEFLRSLRRARQEVDGVAMVLAGSIGLHHVLADLAPINDLERVRVGPLAAPDAELLARRLMLGAGIEPAVPAAVARALSSATGRIPYYLNVTVQRLAERGAREPDTAMIHALVDEMLDDPDDPFDIAHYDTRLDDYYADDAAVVRAVLDAIATGPPAGLDLDQVGSAVAVADLDRRPARDNLLDLLRRLEADHYLQRSADRDQMASEFLARAWRSRRRLG